MCIVVYAPAVLASGIFMHSKYGCLFLSGDSVSVGLYLVRLTVRVSAGVNS